ncbi:MAG: mechanosensitive ion channel [Phaeodactylibacter sp.]|uniref:mechanosensitive ion channel family protein n=1 Tax=Phaeodactylibacter sp. TaxID=1940289 RepID=UPI0032EE18A7
MQEILNQILLEYNGWALRLGQVLLGSSLLVLLAFVYWLVGQRLFPKIASHLELPQDERRKARRILAGLLILLALTALVHILNLDRQLIETANEEAPNLFISTFFHAMLIWQFARLLDFIISRLLITNYYRNRQEENMQLDHYQTDSKKKTNRTVQYAVYILALLFIVQAFEIDWAFYTYKPAGAEDGQTRSFSVSNILNAAFIIVLARLFSWVIIQLILSQYYRSKQINVGSQYAINQLLQYFVYIIAALMALEAIGFTLTLLWGGAAALLVGVGLGLQETFKDLFSGVILLFERRVEVGDVVEVDGLIGTVKRIGVRTSLVETRDNIVVIVPNSRLIVQHFVNWSHNDNKARFYIKVGVTYGSDTELVKQLLLDIARSNAEVIRHPAPFVRFVDFGDSSLDFELHFWSHEFIRIEDVKSAIRFKIDQAFRENNVVIPFPQRDVWMKGK